jgi:hypothetical protein
LFLFFLNSSYSTGRIPVIDPLSLTIAMGRGRFRGHSSGVINSGRSSRGWGGWGGGSFVGSKEIEEEKKATAQGTRDGQEDGSREKIERRGGGDLFKGRGQRRRGERGESRLPIESS